jgi:hypothetical protein
MHSTLRRLGSLVRRNVLIWFWEGLEKGSSVTSPFRAEEVLSALGDPSEPRPLGVPRVRVHLTLNAFSFRSSSSKTTLR